MNLQLNEEFVKKLTEAKSVLFFTGAGISAESGIETFRGENGLWKKLKPEELASFSAFMKNPEMVWEWYQYRRKIISDTSPNPGHFAIAEFEKYFNKVTVVTQNVDNLHQRAGSNTIYELHGNIERNFCVDCNSFYEMIEIDSTGKVPRCTKCNGLIRPDVVWFGEMLPEGVFEKSEVEAANSDICFVVGTSAVVYPAAYIPHSAKRAGSYVIEINIEKTELSHSVDLSFIGKSGEILPQILDKVKELRKPMFT